MKIIYFMEFYKILKKFDFKELRKMILGLGWKVDSREFYRDDFKESKESIIKKMEYDTSIEIYNKKLELSNLIEYEALKNKFEKYMAKSLFAAAAMRLNASAELNEGTGTAMAPSTTAGAHPSRCTIYILPTVAKGANASTGKSSVDWGKNRSTVNSFIAKTGLSAKVIKRAAPRKRRAINYFGR